MSNIIIRDSTANDEQRWRDLWTGYCEFYHVDMKADVTNTTWSRILDPDWQAYGCIVAELDDQVVGFANYILHPHTWSIDPRCYLNDLFVDPDVRGEGIGHALIEFLQRRGGEQGWARVYWLTQGDNARARRLYDRFSPPTDFIQYSVPVVDQ